MVNRALKKVLITGAGTGFGHESAMRLAKKGFDVIAAVEIYAQVRTLKRQAAERGVGLQVEKLDVTSDDDRRKALAWDPELLRDAARDPRHRLIPFRVIASVRPECWSRTQPTGASSSRLCPGIANFSPALTQQQALDGAG
ncbi:SDR family NAD(P)-dependent oxidoreductase [Streptomyces sp. NPDC056930]|uniref:SDR family NAD(P)-dependent oxidoreductase n=1 Tax=Streptomyces sp. NPDC056930 TaxID=3345967 RepID=UPI0036260BF7